MSTPKRSEQHDQRWRQLGARLEAANADAVIVGDGHDLSYLTGFSALALERFIGAVATRAAVRNPTLVVPNMELGRTTTVPDFVDVIGWGDTTDPMDVVASRLDGATTVLVSDDLSAVHVIALQQRRPDLKLLALNKTLGGLRAIKTEAEHGLLRQVGALADAVHAQIQAGELPLIGRTEREIADDVAQRLVDVGHDKAEFVIVASGPNSADPHNHPGDRVVGPDEMVLFDFGGRRNGFCSDTTRCVFTGTIPPDVRAAYDALQHAQEQAFRAAKPGNSLRDVDLAARDALDEAGFGAEFIHRVGHGIGTAVHEHPYLTATNDEPIRVGHAFSIEPGIYRSGQWGMRLEDIVVIGESGAVRCNNTDHDLVSLPGV